MTQRILIVGPTPAVQRRWSFDAFERNQVNRVGQVEVLAAGKGINCARAALRLEMEPQVLTFLGGESGQWLGRVVRDEGILVRSVEATSPTRTCCTLVDKQAGEVSEIVENAGAVSEQEVEQFLAAYHEELGASWMVVLIGTLPPGAPEDLYQCLTQTASERGVPVLVDAQGPALLAAIAAGPLLVKPNRRELAAATGCACDDDAGLRQAIVRLHAMGAHHVLVTDGEKPAYLSDRQNLTRLTPPWVPANNPIGSGDTLSAAIATALVRGDTVGQAVRFGMGCACANTAGEGYGRFDPRLAETLSSRVRAGTEAL